MKRKSSTNDPNYGAHKTNSIWLSEKRAKKINRFHPRNEARAFFTVFPTTNPSVRNRNKITAAIIRKFFWAKIWKATLASERFASSETNFWNFPSRFPAKIARRFRFPGRIISRPVAFAGWDDAVFLFYLLFIKKLSHPFQGVVPSPLGKLCTTFQCVAPIVFLHPLSNIHRVVYAFRINSKESRNPCCLTIIQIKYAIQSFKYFSLSKCFVCLIWKFFDAFYFAIFEYEPRSDVWFFWGWFEIGCHWLFSNVYFHIYWDKICLFFHRHDQ